MDDSTRHPADRASRSRRWHRSWAVDVLKASILALAVTSAVVVGTGLGHHAETAGPTEALGTIVSLDGAKVMMRSPGVTSYPAPPATRTW